MKTRGRLAVFEFGSVLILLAVAATALLEIAGFAQQNAKTPETSVRTKDLSGNPCDEMGAMAGMNVMGESMAAMANHMCMTPMRAKQPGDDEKARAVVAQVKATMEKYKDYKKAIADGYLQANPTVDQPHVWFDSHQRGVRCGRRKVFSGDVYVDDPRVSV